MSVLAMRLLLLPLACLAVISGCRKPAAASSSPTPSPTLLPGTFINSPGSWWAHHASGSFKLDINPTKAGLEYRYGLFDEPQPPAGKLGNGGAGPIESPSWSPDWFFYAEDTGNPTTLWYYGNSRRLSYMTVKDKYSDPAVHTVIDQNGKRSELGRRVPEEVIQRLPADLQKLFPASTASGERPAF